MEKDEAAANAFKLNYPDSIVLTDDCNLILRYVMDVRLLTSSSLLSSLSLYLAPNVHLFPPVLLTFISLYLALTFSLPPISCLGHVTVTWLFPCMSAITNIHHH